MKKRPVPFLFKLALAAILIGGLWLTFQPSDSENHSAKPAKTASARASESSPASQAASPPAATKKAPNPTKPATSKVSGDSWKSKGIDLDVTVTRAGCDGYEVVIYNKSGSAKPWAIQWGIDPKFRDGSVEANSTIKTTVPKQDDGTTRVIVKSGDKAPQVIEVPNC